MKRLLLVTLLLGAAPSVRAAIPGHGGDMLIGRFSGDLTGSNGKDVETTLEIYRDGEYGQPTRFKLREVHRQEGGKSVGVTGEWTLLRGSAAKADDTVYQLNLPMGRERYFVRDSSVQLRELDRNLKKFPKGRHVLKRAR